jgi:hypothetical protein
MLAGDPDGHARGVARQWINHVPDCRGSVVRMAAAQAAIR